MATYSGPIIDSDVHHNPRSEDDFIRHLDPNWRDYVLRGGSLDQAPGDANRPIGATNGFAARAGRLKLGVPFPFQHPRGGVNKRLETFPPNGGPPASDYETLRLQLLEPFRIECAILAFDGIASYAANPNPYFADALVRAINDWILEDWLSIPDQRLAAAIFVPTHIPETGVEEIRRLAKHPRVVEARLPWNGLAKPYGHPNYHPIYAAAADHGLVVSMHINGAEGFMNVAHLNAGGYAGNYLDYHTLAAQSTFNHVASFITHGAFEKFPDLKVLLVETGTTWIPWLLWTLDSQYKALRRESSWVKKLPSEYFREHFRVTTQPLEVPDDPQQMVDLFEAFGGMEDLLCYSSDYPHWDSDDPRFIASKFPAHWHHKVFYENAHRLYEQRLSSLPASQPAATMSRTE
jgi:predicted TIM-barrel fold metal-dependent hydrolase